MIRKSNGSKMVRYNLEPSWSEAAFQTFQISPLQFDFKHGIMTKV